MATSDHKALCANGEGAPALSRRSLLRASPALLVPLLPGTAHASTDTPIFRLFREWDDFQAFWNDTSRAFTDEESDAMGVTLRALEDRIMAEPLTCLTDLAAKLVVSTDYGDFPPDKALAAECEAILAGAL